MGQVLSMIWNWVFHKPNYSNHELNNQLIPSHLINIPDHPQPLIPDDDDQTLANLGPEVPSDSIVVVVSSNLANVEEDEEDKVLHVVAAEEIMSKNRTKDNKQHDGIIVSSCTLIGKISIGPYNSTQRILLVGEGDFSFSACLATAFGSASNILATSLNSREFLIKNYGNFPTNLSELKTRGSRVMHGVDATKMAKHPQLSMMKFDRIIFNFPHAGFRQQESSASQIRRHQELVRGFLKNAKKMIEEDGQIHVTHKLNPFFLKWDIPKLGTDQGLHLMQAVKFKVSKYSGYRTKYGFGGDKDFDCNPSKTYKFALTSQK